MVFCVKSLSNSSHGLVFSSIRVSLFVSNELYYDSLVHSLDSHPVPTNWLLNFFTQTLAFYARVYFEHFIF